MITPVSQHSIYPSYFFITDDTVDVPNLPKNCVISSTAINTVNKSVWVVQKCTTDATKNAWHKVGTSTEVVCV